MKNKNWAWHFIRFVAIIMPENTDICSATDCSFDADLRYFIQYLKKRP